MPTMTSRHPETEKAILIAKKHNNAKLLTYLERFDTPEEMPFDEFLTSAYVADPHDRKVLFDWSGRSGRYRAIPRLPEEYDPNEPLDEIDDWIDSIEAAPEPKPTPRAKPKGEAPQTLKPNPKPQGDRSN